MMDFRCDTVTRPTGGMRRSMIEAPVGDDAFGEYLTVNWLEGYVAEMLGPGRGYEMLMREDSHIFNYEAGGEVYPPDDFAEVADIVGCKMGLRVYLDGIRLFNTQTATGIPAREWCDYADTVSVCSSKGLGDGAVHPCTHLDIIDDVGSTVAAAPRDFAEAI